MLCRVPVYVSSVFFPIFSSTVVVVVVAFNFSARFVYSGRVSVFGSEVRADTVIEMETSQVYNELEAK